MSLADNYFTDEELAEELHTKTGMGTTRVLRKWRAEGVGPPWAKIGRVIIYPKAAFDEWLAAKIQYPVRSRKCAA
jgi:hypothetical protein